MSDDKGKVETETKVNSGEIEKPSATEGKPTESDAKPTAPADDKKDETEVENVLLALAEDPAQNLFMDGKTKF